MEKLKEYMIKHKKMIWGALVAVALIVLIVILMPRSYTFDSNNIFGLKKITVSINSVTMIFDKESVRLNTWQENYRNPIEVYVKYFDERDSIYCYIKGEYVEASDYKCRVEGDNIYIAFKCPGAKKAAAVSFGDFEVRNYSCPELVYTMYGGEIIEEITQKYDPFRKKWKKLKKEDIYCPLDVY